MTRLSAQDASFLNLETRDAPMHIGFLLTFRMPPRAPADYMQKLHAKLERLAVDAAPFNLQLRPREGFGRLVPELEVADSIDIQYHLRHEALPWPGGERELGLAISRLHSTRLERTRPLWECTLIEGLQPDRFALYVKIHHALADGVGLMHQITQMLAESPRGLSLAPWTSPVASAPLPKPVQAADDDWRQFFEGVLAGLSKPKPESRPGGMIPHGPRTILNGDTTGRRRFATQRIDLNRVKAIAKAAEATVNDVVLALCGGALRAYLQEFDRVPKDPLLASVPVALPRVQGQTVGSSVAAVHGTLATELKNPRERLLAIRDGMRAAKEEFKQLPASLSRVINSVGMLAMTLLPRQQKPDPDKATFTNLTISNVPGPKHKLYFHGAEMDGMYPVSVLAGDQRLNITVLGYDDGLFFGLIACPDTLPSVQRIAVQLQVALDELEAAMGLARKKLAAPKAVARTAERTPSRTATRTTAKTATETATETATKTAAGSAAAPVPEVPPAAAAGGVQARKSKVPDPEAGERKAGEQEAGERRAGEKKREKARAKASKSSRASKSTKASKAGKAPRLSEAAVPPAPVPSGPPDRRGRGKAAQKAASLLAQVAAAG